MATQLTFTCNKCGFSVDGWDEGNPYIEHPENRREYIYHPDDDRELCTGNAPDHICMKCGAISKIDPEKDKIICSKCGSSKVEDTYELTGKPCLKCDGTFSEGEVSAIS